MKIRFSSTQLEYGDISLVDDAVSFARIVLPVEHPFRRGGYPPDPVKKVHLVRATKAIGHSDWRVYFRPDICGHHLAALAEIAGVPFELVTPGHIRVNDKDYEAQSGKDELNTYRLLYLTAIRELHGTR